MTLDPRLLEILCCPALGPSGPCHGAVAPVEEGLRCELCGRIYPIQDGIPVMLPDQARRPD